MPDICRSRKGRASVFTVVALAAVAYLVIGIVRGRPWPGVVAVGIMAGYALVLYAARNRSETIGLLGGDNGDERQRELMQRASAFTGQVLVCVIVVGALATFATTSGAGVVFSSLAGVGGVAFAGSLAWLSRHG
jgi:hypothetical protein